MKNFKKIALIITSINKPNEAVRKYHALSKKNKVDLIIIGDKKTPDYPSKYNFYNLKSQENLNFSLNKSLPINSYSRKNIGFLIAMQKNSKIILETDDDNYPKNIFFNNLELQKKIKLLGGPKWINIFEIFKKKNYIRTLLIKLNLFLHHQQLKHRYHFQFYQRKLQHS